jgi:hypothetical protein
MDRGIVKKYAADIVVNGQKAVVSANMVQVTSNTDLSPNRSVRTPHRRRNITLIIWLSTEKAMMTVMLRCSRFSIYMVKKGAAILTVKFHTPKKNQKMAKVLFLRRFFDCRE